MDPPKPPKLAGQIIAAVWFRVEFDRAPLRAHLFEQLKEPSGEYIWPRAERIVADEIDAVCAPELVAQCERALPEATGDLPEAVEDCRAALDDLRQNGAGAWIFRAIRYQVAFDTAADTLNERRAVRQHECLA